MRETQHANQSHVICMAPVSESLQVTADLFRFDLTDPTASWTTPSLFGGS